MLGGIPGELLPLIGVLGEQSYGWVRPLASSTSARGSKLNRRTSFSHRIVEVETRQEQIGAIPALTRPLSGAGRQARIEKRAQPWIIEPARGERCCELLG